MTLMPQPLSHHSRPHPRPHRVGRAGIGLVAALSLPAACSSSNSGPGATSATSSERNDAFERLDTSTRIVSDFRAEIPDVVAAQARCVIVFPALVQGGLIVGGRGGRGFADCLRRGAEWSQPGPVSISGGSLGAQIGVEKVDVLMLVMNDEAKNALLEGHFQVGVDASAAAGPVGSQASKDFKADSGVLSYARTSGLFAGATLSGSKISRDDDATQALYGGLPELRSLLQGAMTSPGAAADRFVAAVRNAFGANAHPPAASGPGIIGGHLGTR